jgi:hypothetical protein
MTTLNIPAPARTDSPRQAQWKEARSVFPIYLALAKQLEIEIPFPQAKRNLPENPGLETFSQVHEWLDSMDQQVLVHQLRHLLQMTTLNASETGLRALIQRHLRKAKKSNVDRDKIDFLLVQYFALCAPAKIYHKQIELVDVAQVMQPVLGDVDPAPLAWCAPLEQMIESLRAFRSLREILKTNFIEQGRKVKETAGGMFYDPAALIAFIRFNFLLRRTLIELMHADLIAIRTGLGQLQSAGVRVIDCHHAELSSAEPLAKISTMADEWKQPFQKEYTERTVSQAFDKLLGLRTDMEHAVEKALGKPTDSAPQPAVTLGTRTVAAAKKSAVESNVSASKTKAKAAVAAPDDAVVLDFENCMEQIWERKVDDHRQDRRSANSAVVLGSDSIRQ